MFNKLFQRSAVLRVFQYIRPYPWYAVGTLACAIVTTLAGFVFPKVSGLIVDRVLEGVRSELLLPYVLAVAASFLVRDGLNAVRIRLNNTFEQNVIRDLRCDLYRVLQRLPLPWFEQRATGDLLTRVSEDVTNVERVLVDGIEQGVVAVLQIVGVGTILLLMNPQLTFWMLLPVPILIGGAAWYTSTAHLRYRLSREATSAMNSLLLDNLQGMRQIKSYAREAEEEARFGRSAEEVRRGSLQVMHAWAWYSPSMAFVAALGSVIVLGVGGADVLKQTGFTKGELITFLLYVGMFYDPINRLHSLNQLWQAGRAAGERVFNIMDTPVEDAARSLEVFTGSRFRGAVEYRQVDFSYREDMPVLRQISVKIEPGMMVALVGATGAGKSTMINLLPRFYEATGGVILIDGQDHRSFSLAALRAQIGLVTQESFLFNTSVGENLSFGRPTASQAEIEAAARAAHAHDFISLLPDGYATNVGERGVKLSVGEKQRIAIARALLKDPPMLILDEATASVDVITERLIQEALTRLLKGRTSFVVAHRLSTVRRADLILVLKAGEIVERGTHEELERAGGIYARLWATQRSDLIADEAFT
jgi:ATP-binding cassette, subfamily B, bacterial